MQDMTALHTLVFNSLEEQIVVIDQAGTIIDVNLAWTNFGAENGLSPKHISAGSNYLKVLSTSAAGGDSLAGEAAEGIMDVISGNSESFYLEYPCHSPNEERWFMMRVRRMKDDSKILFVISHHNITQRRLAEERAEYLAMHDPLTSLANRRYFNQFLNKEMRRSIRNQSVISLIMVDVDYFKEYNDEWGHLGGDQCLVNIGQALSAYCHRASDLGARLGGDEFAVILGGTDFAESQKVAEAILKAINDLKMVFDESRQITVSMGVASIIPNERQNEEFLLQEADKALYSAKLAGRNRVVHSQPPSPSMRPNE
ncbi:MAG: GGDEF domain-containing protein [Gammaproteobacteria bacterium]|nr:GGDEF domain-containing protein [Gammaproteobacteria bacterium]